MDLFRVATADDGLCQRAHRARPIPPEPAVRAYARLGIGCAVRSGGHYLAGWSSWALTHESHGASRSPCAVWLMSLTVLRDTPGGPMLRPSPQAGPCNDVRRSSGAGSDGQWPDSHACSVTVFSVLGDTEPRASAKGRGASPGTASGASRSRSKRPVRRRGAADDPCCARAPRRRGGRAPAAAGDDVRLALHAVRASRLRPLRMG